MQPGQIVIQLLINPNQLFYFIILFLSGELMQPGQSATYLKTTAARKINTHQFRSLFNSVLFVLSPVQVPLQLCTVCTLYRKLYTLISFEDLRLVWYSKTNLFFSFCLLLILYQCHSLVEGRPCLGLSMTSHWRRHPKVFASTASSHCPSVQCCLRWVWYRRECKGRRYLLGDVLLCRTNKDDLKKHFSQNIHFGRVVVWCGVNWMIIHFFKAFIQPSSRYSINPFLQSARCAK